MGIDERSQLGRRLDVGQPLVLDLGKLTTYAGQTICSAMSDGLGRGDAFVTVVNARIIEPNPNIARIDLAKVNNQQPIVGDEIDVLMQAGDTRGQALTRLLVRGAASTRGSRERTEQDKLYDALDELDRARAAATGDERVRFRYRPRR